MHHLQGHRLFFDQSSGVSARYELYPCCIMKCLFNRMKNDEGVYIKSWEHLSTFFSFSLKKKRNKKGKDEEKNIRNWILNETVPVGETWTERERKNGERLGRRYVYTLWHFFRGLFSLASNLKIINRYFLGKKWVNIVKAAYIIIIAYSCVYTQTYYDTNLHFNKNKICTDEYAKTSKDTEKSFELSFDWLQLPFRNQDFLMCKRIFFSHFNLRLH